MNRLFRFTLATFLFCSAGLGLTLPAADPAPPAKASSDESSLADLAKGGVPPKPLKRAPPIYPYGLRLAGQGGRVLVEFVIDREGNVVNPLVVRSNNPWFERPALEAILKWKFAPGTMNGRAVNVRASQLLEFQVDNSRGADSLWFATKPKNQASMPEEFRWEKPPEPVSTAFPVYPFEALQAGLKGKTRIRFIIGPTGAVVAAELIEASAPELGQAALAMADTWVFKPAKKKDGTACYALLDMEHEFRPTGGDVPVSDEARQILRTLAKSPDKIVGFTDLEAVPKPRSRRPPVYPSALRAAGREGSAVVEFFIDENGDAQLPRIVSQTAPEFGYAAVQAVATWRYEVPRKGGRPTVTRARIPLEFSLK